MPLICLEGASAVGKTTTCQALAEQLGAYIVPEVNLLFERPQPEPIFWYFEQQVERWAIAQEKLKNHDLVIFDGDPFQPLWYNWAFNFVDWQPLDVLRGFYRQQLIEDKIGFPDGYFLLTTQETQLRQQKENDLTRSRSGFEKHLQIIEPQQRYFQAMNQRVPGLVSWLEVTNVASNLTTIISNLPTFSQLPKPPDWLTLFDSLIEWLSKNKP
jgi:hypothetical protein